MKKYFFSLVLLGVTFSVWFLYAPSKKCGCPANQVSATRTVPETVKVKDGLRLSPSSLSPLTLCQAIVKAAQAVHAPEDDIGPDTKIQEGFLESQYLPFIKENMRKKFTDEELQSYASRNYQELNTILKNKGFSIRLPQFAPTNIGIVAIQDVLVQWLLEGRKDTLTAASVAYDAFALKVDSAKEGPMMGQQNIHFFAKDAASIVAIQLFTRSDDVVYCVTKRDGELFEKTPTKTEIADAIIHYSALIKDGSYPLVDDSFNGVLMPMISYDEQPDVSWMEKMRIGTAHVALAMQQVIFKMNEKGARAQAAAAMIVTMAYPGMKHKEQLIVDKPFLIWIERPGVALPIFAGYMTQQYWKNPGALQTIR